MEGGRVVNRLFHSVCEEWAVRQERYLMAGKTPPSSGFLCLCGRASVRITCQASYSIPLTAPQDGLVDLGGGAEHSQQYLTCCLQERCLCLSVCPRGHTLSDPAGPGA